MTDFLELKEITVIYIRKLDQDEPTQTKFNSVFGITKKYEKK
jgi:hypothetical protein